MIDSPKRQEHVLTAAVALAFLTVALFEGGYSIEARAVIAALVWTAVLAGVGFGLIPLERPPRAALISGVLLTGLLLLTMLSVIWSSDDGRATGEAVRVSVYLGIFVLVVGCSRRGLAMPWLKGLTLGILAVAGIAVLTRAIPALPGGDEELNALLPAANGRLSHPIGYWNALGAICALGGVLVTWFSVWAGTPPKRALAVASMPLLGLAIYLTSSRGGVVALAAGVLALLVIGPRRERLLVGLILGIGGTGLVLLLARDQPELRAAIDSGEAGTQGAELLAALIAVSIALGAARAVADGLLQRLIVPAAVKRAAVGVAAVIAVVAIVVSDPAERLDEFKDVPQEGVGRQDFVASHLTSGSGSGRWQFWGEALDAFGSEPLHGIGAGAYGSYWNRNAPINQVTGDAHSLYLEQLAELGLLGGGLVDRIRALGGGRFAETGPAFPGSRARCGDCARGGRRCIRGARLDVGGDRRVRSGGDRTGAAFRAGARAERRGR